MIYFYFLFTSPHSYIKIIQRKVLMWNMSINFEDSNTKCFQVYFVGSQYPFLHLWSDLYPTLPENAKHENDKEKQNKNKNYLPTKLLF